MPSKRRSSATGLARILPGGNSALRRGWIVVRGRGLGDPMASYGWNLVSRQG